MKQAARADGSTPQRTMQIWAVPALLAMAVSVVPVLTISRHIPLTYNEGWNAYFTVRAIDPAAGPLYPGPSELISNNYPPLSFYITGAAAALTGDAIVAGRLIALAALIACAALAAAIVRQLGGTARAAMAAAALLLLHAAFYYPQYVAMADPQWLAQAIMLGGLAVLLRGGCAAAAGAGLVMAAALLTKHNILGEPAAVAAWLLMTDRRRFAAWGAAIGLALAGSIAVLSTHFGPAFAADVFHHAREFSWLKLLAQIPNLAPLLPLAAATAWLVRARGVRDPAACLIGLFAVAALVSGIAQRGGVGVNYNAHFETLAALAIGGGLALSDAARGDDGRTRVTAPMLSLVLALPLLLAAPFVAWREGSRLATLDARDTAWRVVERRIAATPGPVACELLAQCYWAGKPFEWDFFNTGQRLRGHAADSLLARRIAAHGFAAIVLTRAPGFAASDSERLPRPLPALIERNYRPVLYAPDDMTMMVPR